jgi:peptidoglycan hydrolase-like protein with peptidoglycan-binding domain
MTSAADHRRRLGLGLALGAVIAAAGVGAIVTADEGQGDTIAITADAGDESADSTDESAESADEVSAPVADAAAAPVGLALPDLEGDLGQNEVEPTAPIEPERADGGCTIGALSVRLSSQGDGVACLQQALADEGLYSGAINGDFDDATLRAVLAYQEQAGLFVDGVVGRESAIELGIWPDEESLVVRTPTPAPDTYDSTGYLLSPVASMGDAAPPLPDNSGSGRRVVYDRAGQRVWAVDENDRIVRSWLVSGSKYSNEAPGTHTVYSRSEMSTAWNGQAFLPNMIRYQQTEIGHIGFHGIPRHVSDNSPYQTTEELGTRLSGGCQRQHDLDAAFLWAFADVGTTVVVT